MVQKNYLKTFKIIGLLLWPVGIGLTVLYWAEISALSWYWKVTIFAGHIFFLNLLRSPEMDQKAETDSHHRGIRRLISQKKFLEALSLADRALYESPQNAELLYAKGECHQNLEQIQDAEQAYLKTIKEKPSHAFAANNLATLYMNRGDYLKAAEYYRIAQESGATGDWFERNIHRIWNNLLRKGTELAKEDKILDASKYFVLAKDFGANGQAYNNNLRLIKEQLIEKGKSLQDSNIEIAMQYVDAVISLTPEDAIAYAWRGTLLYELAHYSEAIEDLYQCRKLDPSYRPTEMKTLIGEVQSALTKSNKVPCAQQDPEIKENISTTEQQLWKIGQYAFNKYQVRKIVPGGMGYVYICWNREGQMFLVLKAVNLNKIVSNTRTTGERICYKDILRNEAEVWSQLGQHPNIVQLYTVEDFEHRHLVLSMEYIHGQDEIGPTLRDHLNHKKCLLANQVIQVGIDICSAMQYAYDKFKLVHRDLKPENIFLTETGEAKVGDFGLAVKEGDLQASICGTGPYIAPEVLYNPPAPAMDIYAVGVLLYESLAGTLPIPNDEFTNQEILLENWITMHKETTPTPICQIGKGLPADLCKVVMHCLDKKPSQRFRSYKELCEALRKCANNSGYELKAVKTEMPSLQEAMMIYNDAVSLDSIRCYNEALIKYQECVKAEPFRSKISMGWCNMGKVLGTMQCYSEALECFEKAIQIDPKDTHALFGKANTLALLEKYDHALHAIELLLTVDPMYSDAYGCKGHIFLHTDKLDEAEKAYNKALQLHKSNEHACALNGLGLCAKKRGFYEKALEYFDKAISIKGDYAEAFNHRCEMLRLLGQLDEAVKSGRNAVKEEPSVPEYWVNLAMAYGEDSLFDKAAECFQKAIDLDCSLGDAWFGLATCYAENEQPDLAIQYAEEAYRHDCPEGKILAEQIEKQFYHN